MLWIVYAEDEDDGASLRTSGRDAHLHYLEAEANRLLLGGGLLDDEGPGRFGSCFIINVPNRAAAEAWMANEPYNKSGHFNPQARPKTAEGE